MFVAARIYFSGIGRAAAGVVGAECALMNGLAVLLLWLVVGLVVADIVTGDIAIAGGGKRAAGAAAAAADWRKGSKSFMSNDAAVC